MSDAEEGSYSYSQ
jgi:tetratricopeptide (TPR) repeat protein